MTIDRSLALRAGAVQLALVAVIFAALALAFDHEFFEDWGWLTGPLAWAACAAATARILRLPLNSVMLAAAASGIGSLVAVAFGAHTAGLVVAICLFAILCGRLRPAGAV